MYIINIPSFLNKTIKKLSYSDNPKSESEFLLSYVSGYNRSVILISDTIKLSKKKYKYLKYLVYRRSLGEPIAYIIKEKEFWSLSLCVSYDTLIPRPDTEILVEQVISKITKQYTLILDLGTGSGAIALALAQTCSYWHILGVDKCYKALNVARFNASKLNLKNVSFHFSNWFSHINKKFHVIVSNPPYISKKEIKWLKKDIFFEPVDALISRKHGLADIEKIVQKANYYLLSDGLLFIEHGWQQKLKVQKLFKKYHFVEIQSYKDYGGNDRVTVGRKYNK